MDNKNAVETSVEHIIAFGLSDITLEKLEVELIKTHKEQFIEDVIKKIASENIYDMEFKPIQYILTPKNRFVFDYRKAALIHPACLAKYTSLVLLCAEEIEKHRIDINDKKIFSYRVKIDGNQVFNKDINYSLWKEDTKEKIQSKQYQYLVECDISAFYDRINIHRLESTLLSLRIDKLLVKKINDLLLFWSKKDSYGIPVGNSASRILAEAALIDIDQYLVSEGVIFTRYVDDFRLFCPDLITAQKWMNQLTTRLFRDGLMLNTGKTKLKKIEDIEVSEAKESALPETEKPEEVLKVITKLSGGYNRISRKFIMPSNEKHASFKNIEIDKEIEILKAGNIFEFQGIQKITIAIIVQNKHHKLVEMAEVCSKYLYGLDYFIDMLLKNKNFIPDSHREEVANFYEQKVYSNFFYSFEWHSASIVKLLSDEAYFRKNALFHIIKSIGKEVSTYPSILALESLVGRITRSEFRTIREWFDRCDDWEKRRIIVLSNTLPNEERKAWLKAIKSTIPKDILMQEELKKGL
ncbi:RNA-directed DNA polymerase [Leptospira meyeri]|uniref:RNA-directed DNA polymerase n=1 Tax=Leptospira meyeri TaxID=29508 RepID=UPI0013FDBB91|nr:RNA-directed DNA polymerase [Leptospira meyeri]